MTRLALVAAALSACSFSAQSADPGATADGGPTLDGTALVGTCHVHDPSLRLCLDFEDSALSPSVHDGSSFAHDAITSNILPMPRAGEQAAQFSSASAATIAATPDFAVPRMTIEAWMKRDEVSAVGWALLAPMHYGLGIEGGNVVCALGDKTATADAGPFAGQWLHAACTFDGHKLILYVNGSVAACSDSANVKGTSDLGIGVGVTGGIDNVRLYAAALAPADVCARAGGTGCAATCPD